MFKNKTLLITGGTGSFGNAVLNGFLNSDIAEIRIFSVLTTYSMPPRLNRFHRASFSR